MTALTIWSPLPESAQITRQPTGVHQLETPEPKQQPLAVPKDRSSGPAECPVDSVGALLRLN